MPVNSTRVNRPSTAAHRKTAPSRESSSAAALRPISAAALRRPISGARNRSGSIQSNSSLPATRPPTATTRLPQTRPPTAITRRLNVASRSNSPDLDSQVKHVLNSNYEHDGDHFNPTPAASRRYSKVMKMKASYTTTHELMGEIYSLCEELGLGEEYTRELQAALEASTGTENLERTRDELLSHKKVLHHAHRHIDVRERVLKCMTTFVHTYTGIDASKFSSPLLSEKEELNAFKKVSLSMVRQAEGESILGSLRSCTQTVHEALDMWVASLDRLGAANNVNGEDTSVSSGGSAAVLRVSSSLANTRISRAQNAPKPEPRFVVSCSSDYRRKMVLESDKYARLQAVWGLPVAPTPATPSEDVLNTSTSSTDSVAKKELLLIEIERRASINIQRMWRGKYGRMIAAYRRIRVQAAVRIQRWFRRTTRILRLTVRIGRSKAARTIQAGWRASYWRKEQRILEYCNRAAVVVQRAFKVWSKHLYWQDVISDKELRKSAGNIMFRFLRRICFIANLNTKISHRNAATKIQLFVRGIWSKRSNHVDLSEIKGTYSCVVAKDTDIAQPPVLLEGDFSDHFLMAPSSSQSSPSRHDTVHFEDSRASESIRGKNTNTSHGSLSHSFLHPQESTPTVPLNNAMNTTTPAAITFSVESSVDSISKKHPKEPQQRHQRVYPNLVLSDNEDEEDNQYEEEVQSGYNEYDEESYFGEEEEYSREVPIPLACRRVRSIPTTNNCSRIVYETEDMPAASRKDFNFWKGDFECAATIQNAFRGYSARKAVQAKRADKQQRDMESVRLQRLHSNVVTVQVCARTWIASFVVSRRCPLEKVSAVRIQRWWRKWANAPITIANRRHRDYLAELEKFESILGGGLQVPHSKEQAKIRKQCAMRISAWTKDHLDRQKKNAAAQQTIVRSWRHYLCQRQYCMKKYLRRMELARLAAVELQRLEELEEKKRKGAALVILYYYAKWRLRTLVQRLDRVCDEVRSRPDRRENAMILQKFWRLSIAKLDVMKRRRIAAQEQQRTAQEEQLFNAALRIQTLQRQIQAKRRAEETRKRIKEDQNYAAAVIQRNTRMWLAKIRSDEMRLGHLSMYKEFQRLLTRKQYRTNQL